MMIRKPFDPVERKAPKPYNRIEKVYRLKRDEHYNSIYVEVGEVDVCEQINSYAAGCSLKSILERCSLMPAHDKVRYLNQREDGVSADLSNMPKDGMEALLLFQKYQKEYPEVFERIAKGESFDSVIASIGKNTQESALSSVAAAAENSSKSTESEVNSNGK